MKINQPRFKWQKPPADSADYRYDGTRMDMVSGQRQQIPALISLTGQSIAEEPVIYNIFHSHV
jgi:hypothetical protein